MLSRRLLVLLVAPALLGAGVGAAGAQRDLSGRHPAAELPSPVVPDRPAWAPGEVVVQFERGAGKRVLETIPPALGARVSERVPLYDVAVLRLGDDVNVRAAVESLSSVSGVDSATPNYLGYFTEIPDDPRFDHQWGMHNTGQIHPSSVVGRSPRGKPDADIDAPRAWDVEEGDPGTVVAVIDTGVDIRHVDLDANIWTNPGEIRGDDLDNDGNGFVDDVHGWDVAEDDNTLVERDPAVIPYQHGTHIAGIIAAEKGNDRGVVGVCPECTIMPVKIAKPVGRGEPRFMSFRLSDELEGIAYAQEMGADIVNASFGRARWLEVERDAFVELGRTGTLAVIAAGNSGTNHDIITKRAIDNPRRLRRPRGPSYPAAYDLETLVTVAASADRDSYGLFTDSGRETVDLAAPGVDVFSTIPGVEYDLLSGTSMAAPHVTGAAGLAKSHRPLASPANLRNALMNSVDEPRKLSVDSARNPGIITRTQGRLNAADALSASMKRKFRRTDGNVGGARRIRRVASGHLQGLGDYNDVYRRRLRHGDRIVVALDSGRAPFDLFVWKPGTKEIWQLEESCFTTDPGCALLDWVAGSDDGKKISFRVGRTGRYFFHVSARNRERGRYTLRVHRR